MLMLIYGCVYVVNMFVLFNIKSVKNFMQICEHAIA